MEKLEVDIFMIEKEKDKIVEILKDYVREVWLVSEMWKFVCIRSKRRLSAFIILNSLLYYMRRIFSQTGRRVDLQPF